MIGLIPTYAQIGVAAPMLLLFCRLLQGIGLGGEWGGAVLMAFEYAPRDRRGFMPASLRSGWRSAWRSRRRLSRLLTSRCRPRRFSSWGWRLAFLLSLVLVGVGARDPHQGDGDPGIQPRPGDAADRPRAGPRNSRHLPNQRAARMGCPLRRRRRVQCVRGVCDRYLPGSVTAKPGC